MKGHVRNCKLCHEPMGYSAFSMCNKCLAELDKVSNFMKKHSHISIQEISKETSLSIDSVQKIVAFIFNRGTSNTI